MHVYFTHFFRPPWLVLRLARDMLRPGAPVPSGSGAERPDPRALTTLKEARGGESVRALGALRDVTPLRTGWSVGVGSLQRESLRSGTCSTRPGRVREEDAVEFMGTPPRLRFMERSV